MEWWQYARTYEQKKRNNNNIDTHTLTIVCKYEWVEQVRFFRVQPNEHTCVHVITSHTKNVISLFSIHFSLATFLSLPLTFSSSISLKTIHDSLWQYQNLVSHFFFIYKYQFLPVTHTYTCKLYHVWFECCNILNLHHVYSFSCVFIFVQT